MLEGLMTGLDEVDAFLAGRTEGYRVSVPAEIDVKRIRKGLKMTQARFSDTFGFSLDAVKHWEGGRRTPESSARAFLTVIAKNPGAVVEALHPHLPGRRQVSDGTESLAKATRAVPRAKHNRSAKQVSRAKAGGRVLRRISR